MKNRLHQEGKVGKEEREARQCHGRHGLVDLDGGEVLTTVGKRDCVDECELLHNMLRYLDQEGASNAYEFHGLLARFR